MKKFHWTTMTILSQNDFQQLKGTAEQVQPNIGALDTETDGLHIIQNKPFVIQFGFLDEPKMQGYSYAIDLEQNPELGKEVLTYWNEFAKTFKYYLGQNIKFDLHMLDNIGFPYEGNNVSDTMFWMRLGHDSLHPEEGGPPMGLKEYASKYIDEEAKTHEQLLTREQSDITKRLNNSLKNMLNRSNAKLPKGARSFTLKIINELFKDCVFEASDLPEDIKKVYFEWLATLPLTLQHKIHALVESDMIPYNMLNRENLLTYAHYDIIYTLEIYFSLKHIVEHRKQLKGIELENRCIMPWFEMEKQGFQVDTEYLESCRLRLKSYIKERRKLFYDLAGKEIAVGQHAAIKGILNTKFNLNVKSTGNEPLNSLKNTLDNGHPAKEFIDLLQELRTLEKWYSAYIIRFQKELDYTDRLYTTINQVGTVSGRVTSDFQQFPKNPILDYEGNELFHPRKIIKTNTAIVYLDYSQIELRFQALYTILVGHPDLNMCRAYMPYECVDIEGHVFEPENKEDLSNWDGKWYDPDTLEQWQPTDVHGATTTAATGLTPDDPNFKKLRSTIGKRVNFAKNYGAQLGKIKQMFPGKSNEECIRINDAYYKAFPGVKTYHEYCTYRAQEYSYTNNLFGIRYYNASGHKLKNLLIQGSAAYFLKYKIIELYNYCKENNIKTKLQMQIHDELSWEWNPEDPPEIFYEFKKIMEDYPSTQIPIIADMEATNDSWASKIDIDSITQLKEVLNYE